MGLCTVYIYTDVSDNAVGSGVNNLGASILRNDQRSFIEEAFTSV